MHTITFASENKTTTHYIPSQWNEMNLEELLFISPRVMFKNASAKLKSDLVLFFLKKHKKALELMNMSQMKGLWPAVDWLFNAPELTKQPMPTIVISGKKYIGLADGLADISGERFAFSDKYMNAFLKNKDEAQLNLLIAILYVPEGETFQKEKAELVADQFASCSLAIRFAILAFYLGCRHKIAKDNPQIFKKQNKVKHSKLGWMGLFYDLAGPKTGTYQDVSQKNLFELFAIMYKLDEEAEETERRLKKGK